LSNLAQKLLGLLRMQLKNIVVGVDFSEGSELAVKSGLNLARRHGARLHLIFATAVPEPTPEAHLYSEILAQDLRRARAHLEEMRVRLSGQGAEITHAVIDGPAQTALPQAAAELDADMLLCGSHGRTGIQRFLLGSVAERLSRHAECPVLVARKELPPAGPKRVLVAVDFSELTERALAALPPIVSSGTEIELFHGWMFPLSSPPYYGGPYTTGGQMDQLRKALAEEARGRGAKLLASVKSWAPGAKFHTIEGLPIPSIVTRLEERDYDLAVLGSHGRSGMRRWMLGSVAERVVRHARCSVLVVR
jgi:nucleotide-binding universal stress UspA family protein